jgi:integrase
MTVKPMTTLAKEYLVHRRSLGYRLKVEGGLLLKFAQFADREAPGEPLDALLALRWARLPDGADPLYCSRRLEIVRCFARYVAVFDPRTQVPEQGLLGKAHRRVTPHIYTVLEVNNLIAACADLHPVGGLRPHTCATFFGLLVSTGLRVSEGLHLEDDDVDFDQSVVVVRNTKYRKSRLVPIDSSCRDALADYRRTRRDCCPASPSRAFFLTDGGCDFTYGMLRYAFRTVVDRLGWRNKVTGVRLPRVYDLRHTFASRRIALWQEEGADLAVLLPALSTYLGHAKVTDTYWYLTAVPELLAAASRGFEQSAAFTGGRMP